MLEVGISLTVTQGHSVERMRFESPLTKESVNRFFTLWLSLVTSE